MRNGETWQKWRKWWESDKKEELVMKMRKVNVWYVQTFLDVYNILYNIDVQHAHTFFNMHVWVSPS